MHNIDRTVGEANYEYNNEAYGLNPESYEYSGEFENYELEGSNEFEFESGMGNEFEYGQGEMEYSGETYGEYQGEGGYASQELSSEALEMELATELLGVQNEMELEQFLGKLIKRVAKAGSSFLKSGPGKMLGGILRTAAQKALPIAGGAVGTMFGGPLGGMIGNKLSTAASNLFELELEGLSNEDKEFELSRAYVRFANDAVRKALRHPHLRHNPQQAVRSAVAASARRWAPGLLRRKAGRGYGSPRPYGYSQYNYNNGDNGNGNGNGAQASGTWYKQGNQIILNL